MKKQTRRKSANAKIVYIGFVMAIIFAVVTTNVFVVSVFGYHFNSATSFKDDVAGIHIVDRTIPAKRGEIVDRNNTVIAQDVVAYTLQASLDPNRVHPNGSPAHISDKQHAADIISGVLGISREDTLNYLNQDAKQIEFGPAGKYINSDQKETLEASGIPGLMFEQIISRNYPNKVFASKLVGYSQYDESYKRQVGKMGFEEYYDELLTGTDGSEKYTQDRDEYQLRFDDGQRVQPIPGDTIKLTLDRGIQDALDRNLMSLVNDPKVQASEAMGIVVDVKTGEILAWSDAPSFDPNILEFKGGFTNRVSNDNFEPGSTMKTFTVASAIENGVWNDAETFNSSAFHVGIDGDKAYRASSSAEGVHTITNAGNISYGEMRYDYGYALSSNVMIAELLTRKLDPEVFHNDLKRLGFFEKVDTEGVSDEPGNDLWYEPLEKITNGFGQGSTVSLLQMAQAYTAVLNNGVMVKPYVVKEIVDGETNEVIQKGQTQTLGRIYKESTAKHVQELMRYVVAPTGSGTRFNIEETNVIAKTGTAQTVVAGEAGYSPTIYNFSSAVALPYEDPQVLVYTVYKARYGHDVDDSAVYVRDILRKVATTYNMSKTNENQTIQETSTNMMPNVVNMPIKTATDTLGLLGYKSEVIGSGGTVIRQEPSPNTRIINNERVLLLSSYESMVMPDMTGWTRNELLSFMKITGLTGNVDGNGRAISQSISPGTPFRQGDNLDVNLQ